jgi:hypothetical protein
MAELVVINGANNVAKSVIRGLTASGKYSTVRLLDVRPYKQSVYEMQREIATNGVTLDKRQTTNAQALDIALEGADKVVYFTHDYTVMTPCKNNFLIGASKLAKKHGVSSMVAVCPVEHDFAYSETESTWVEMRQEAEQSALDANKNLSVLNTDLVYGEHASHLIHYMHQCAQVGKISGAFLSDAASFKPVAQDDLVRAVQHASDSGLTGQWAVRGNSSVTMKELMNLVEASNGKTEGSTVAHRQLPVLPPFRIMEEFLFGMAADTNMAEMLTYFSQNQEEPVQGADFWAQSGLSPETDLHKFFKKLYLEDGDDRLVFPTFGSYKLGYTD